jgi:hypothetical protein
MASLVVSDRILGQQRSQKLKSRFERALEEEFTEPDGRILAVRNETTGLTVGTSVPSSNIKADSFRFPASVALCPTALTQCFSRLTCLILPTETGL